MALIDDILASLPDDAPVEEVLMGARSTAVLGGRLGLAYRFGASSEPPGPENGSELPKSARQLARLATSTQALPASIGVAAINSLVGPRGGKTRPGNAYQLLLETAAGRDVTLVGHFSFVERLRPEVRNLWVLELCPQPGDLPAGKAPEVIPRSDAVAITGSSLVNHTLDELLKLAAGRYVILVGASTVFSPVLFDYGVSAVCGAVARDPRAVLQGVRAGKSFRDIDGLSKLIWSK